ncbi:MAG: tol-pal system-associated acyl-CoA thioesterase [Alphaproteobacteria bacterium]|nr:tol-pal system-associated acyl-CoA thioesterase [Alphaproteobacteria bacterium]
MNSVLHQLKIRVYYEDSDAGGIVYHANYFKFAERARSEMLRSAFLSPKEIADTYQIMFVVKKCTIDYIKPAKFDDLLMVQTMVLGCHAASLDLQQKILRDKSVLASLEVKLACVNLQGQVSRLPKFLYDGFKNSLKKDNFNGYN